jgi:hypothetical protein
VKKKKYMPAEADRGRRTCERGEQRGAQRAMCLQGTVTPGYDVHTHGPPPLLHHSSVVL